MAKLRMYSACSFISSRLWKYLNKKNASNWQISCRKKAVFFSSSKCWYWFLSRLATSSKMSDAFSNAKVRSANIGWFFLMSNKIFSSSNIVFFVQR